jgi:ATP-dependent RNA helicase RhlB
MKFEEFNLHEDVMKGIRDAGFEQCMPVQEETLKLTLAGKDVTVQSQTGSGKTAAFLLTIFQQWCTASPQERKSSMIIAPTRELAVQIEEEAQLLGAHLDIRSACFYGGVGYREQEDALKAGVDLYIGTPGRLIDFGQSRKIDFKSIGNLVIDEADRLFDMGFYPDIQRMMRMMVPREQRSTLLFSATLGTKVLNLAWEHMNNPEAVSIEPEHITVEEISQELYHVEGEKRISLLLGLLKKYDPATAIVFTNMKITAVEVAKRLTKNGYAARYLMGDLPQKKRLSIINKVKRGEIRFLVATDVAARGLHVNDLAMVINYDIPEDAESYVHRIGRTARAGKSGKAITLACERYVYGLEPIEELLNRKIPLVWAEEELFIDDNSAGIDFRGEYRKASSDGRGRFDRAGRDSRGKQRARSSSGSRGTQGAPPRRKGGKPPARKGAPLPRSERSGSGPDRPAKERPPVRKPQETRKVEPAASPDRSKSMEQRLEMYRKKYGEDFTLKSASGEKKGQKKELPQAREKKPKEGFFSRLKRKLSG